MKRVLRLNLKGCYFDAIKAGVKTHEFRLASKWLPRLQNREFDEVHICKGYPKLGDESRTIKRKWKGFELRTITHPHFGEKPVEVLAIDVTQEVQP